MRTKFTIIAIVSTCMAVAIAVFVVGSLWLGWLGFAICTFGAIVVVAMYILLVRPWHARWGATDEEVARAMPGDNIIPNAASSTRAITIHSSPAALWPWLVQIGYGRAGWYSYDWIDNDGKPSARKVVRSLQHLEIGDVITMVPGMGPKVREVKPLRYFVAGDRTGGTWCLAIYPAPDGARLVSRWRQNWKGTGIAARFFIAISDPGAFIMERKMLLGIKERAEATSVRRIRIAA